MQSSSKPKKTVHYDNSTKGGKSHSHRSSKDSGVGSSSASDRASLGTAPDPPSPFSPSQVEDQRANLHSVREALGDAYQRIKSLERSNEKLDSLLKESNSENRLLKKEKAELVNEVAELRSLLEDEKRLHMKQRQMESSPRISASRRESIPERPRISTTPPESKTMPPRPILRNSTARVRQEEDEKSSSQSSRSERDRPPRRDSTQQPSKYDSGYEVPPVTSPRAEREREYPNPFAPLPQSPAASIPRSMAGYATPAEYGYATAPSHLSYTREPQFEAKQKRSSPPNDGTYHLYPV